MSEFCLELMIVSIDVYLFIFLFNLYLSLDANIKSKHLEELKGKSNFVQ